MNDDTKIIIAIFVIFGLLGAGAVAINIVDTIYGCK